ncbi:serine protease Do [Rhodothalassium salexigens DSM 2132]|uniref:Probable periplasmic serine endoprotease DegP-like n=1 Tax=Rhodothalassium salexigens DSM 2132 TaxID=1188247 RepID=A0A4R2PAB7_RHOSA|nr:DegQ family serine endoprotease [Rhodothalassium salexigens]MBB4212366.1 serine protease Do [Rhodothalassium salexigens DSM 2132]TCP32003.1 serine protease Do [Rhodothalassium salexigens DSM 2132]
MAKLWLMTAGLGAALLLGAAGAKVPVAQEIERQVPHDRQDVLLSYAPVVERVAPAVVNIYTRKQVAARESAMAQMFREFFGQDIPQRRRQRVLSSLGSGVIVRPDGVIVTNNHVVADADEITVALSDRREFDAEVVVADERTDLAVLRIDTDGEKLPTLAFADSETAMVGDIVLAIGNPFGLNQTVTSGIVSATARTRVGITDLNFFIQTDAAINPGNSGGALVDLQGRLLGVNSAIYSRSGQSAGIGFAVPANMVETVVRAALNEGEVVRPWIGVATQPVTRNLAASLGLDRPGGVLIDRLYPKGPAERAGLRPGDVILAVNGREVLDESALTFRVATTRPGSAAAVTILRDGRTRDIAVDVALPPERPKRDLTALDGRHPFQGVEVGNLSPRFNDELGLDPFAEGVVVVAVERRSPAGRLRWLRKGDIIRGVDGTKVDDVAELERLLDDTGSPFNYRIERDGQVADCVIADRGRRFGCQRVR